jgi:hypothetical protein
VARAIAELATDPLVLLCFLHLSVLALRLPLFDHLPGWMFTTRAKAVGPWYLLVALAGIPVAGRVLERSWRGRPRATLCALVLLGFALQHGFAWSEGRGLAGMRDRVVTTGHAEFARVAAEQQSMWDVLVRYEAKVGRGELGLYAHTKPPGQLLFYMATERAARGLARDDSPAARLDAMRDLAAVLWPLLSYLVLLPMFLALRQLIDEQTALRACLLYLVVPSVALITLATDQVLIPLLFMLTIWLVTTAQKRRSWRCAVTAGAVLYLGSFVTFPVLLAAPVAAAFALAVELQASEEPTATSRGRALVKTAGGVALGFGLLFVLFAACLHYDFFARLSDARLSHERWKVWQGDAVEVFYFAWLDYLEFAVFLGVPLTLLGLSAARRAIRVATVGDFGALGLPAIAISSVFLYLGFFGHTKVETARLWLFLVPLCCGLAAAELRARADQNRNLTLSVVLALQWLTVWLTKAGQDFW